MAYTIAYNAMELIMALKGFMEQGPYSQHFFFFVTYELGQWARVFHYIRLEMLARNKHSSLLGQFVSYEENKVLWIRTQVS